MPRPRIDFAPEWIALLPLALIDLVWASAIDFHLTITWGSGKLLGATLTVMVLMRLFAFARAGMMAEYFSLTTLATLLFAILSYLCLASSGPLIDDRLMAADRALGFDWMAGYRFLTEHDPITTVLGLAYNSLVYQGLYFCVLLALMGRVRRMRQMFWLVLGMGAITSLGVLLFPALGPFKMLHAGPRHSFVPEMEYLRSGQPLNITLSQMTGVVSFPSFHTAMALAYVWGFRGTGAVFWGVAALNLAMLAAIPWFGGHYLMDMIGGAVTMAVSLAMVCLAPRLRLGTARLPQEATGISAGV
jgi:hypothetical protein